MIYVDAWPQKIGLTVNPTPEQCREAGYELSQNKPQDVIDAEREAAEHEAADQAAHEALVSGLRAQYRELVHTFCQLAGIPEVDKFETTDTVMTEIEKANSGPDVMKALRMTQTALALRNVITELRRKDGDDAWERI